jgi:hypothetical protein
MLSTWRHSGFYVFCGNRISADEETVMENLTRTIIRAPFSQERMQCSIRRGRSSIRQDKQELPRSGVAGRHVFAYPEPGEQMVRYHGYYSNGSPGKRQKEGSDETIPCILEPLGDENGSVYSAEETANCREKLEQPRRSALHGAVSDG